jgi:hypothetical protein
MTRIEQWQPIPGWENCYSASDLGRIRSEDRTLELPSGQVRTYRGRILSQYVGPDGRCQVNLRVAGVGGGHRVHRLVLEAFVGPCPEGMEACHFDDDSSNNRLDNLRWDTSLANKVDMARNGNGNQNWNRTHCVRGHEYTGENTYIRTNGNRDCRACWALRPSAYQLRGNDNKDKTHCVNGHEFTPENTYDYSTSTKANRQCRTCALARAKARKNT